MKCTCCGKDLTEGHPFMLIVSEKWTYCDMACENMDEAEGN